MAKSLKTPIHQRISKTFGGQPVLFLPVERPGGGDDARAGINPEQIRGSVFERVSDEAVVAFVLVGGENGDDGRTETGVLRNSRRVALLREDGIIVVDVDDVDDDGGRGRVWADRRISTVVPGHDHQMITLLDFAIERKTA